MVKIVYICYCITIFRILRRPANYRKSITMKLEIREISTKRELKQFVKFQNILYKDHPCYIPTLESDDLNTLNWAKNPAFDFCDVIYFMAYRDNKPVGRIAGIINNIVNSKEGKLRARFGFVDFVDDAQVADALFAAVVNWARERGMTQLHGPLGFSDMDPEGMLVEGFDQLGTMVTIYNHPYYMAHLERMGFAKDADWVEFKIAIPAEVPDKYNRMAQLIAQKHNLRVVKCTSRKETMDKYGTKLFELVNLAYNDLYGYSPLTGKQIKHYVDLYLPMLKLNNLTLIEDQSGELIAMSVAMPSIAKALQKSGGKLFPFGFIHLLRALKGRNDVAELLLIAIKPEYQNKGLISMIFSDIIPVFNKNGYKYAESNPELELNTKVQNQWQLLEREQHKRRRIYLKEI